MIRLLIIPLYLWVAHGVQFSDDIARQLWFMTSSGYCSNRRIRQWTCGRSCDSAGKMEEIELFFNTTGSNAGYGAYERTNNTIYIIFRGTEPWYLKNLVDDLDFIKTEYPYCPYQCQVHRGFYLSAQSLLGQVRDYIDK